ncbi:helix-turn-helix domain-containing protein [Aeromonas sp. 96A]|uniref:helix-turn-helix domain-containing protein n=1 Tax=Aeromonas sp. 96A TaxID=3452730 RepID=UPI003F791AF4
MSNQSLLHESAQMLIEKFNGDATALAICTRVLNLLNEVAHEIKTQSERFAALPDEQLLSELFLTLATHRTMVSKRDLRKQVQRLQADKYFLDTIKDNGGLYKAGEVANIMGVSRQTINNQRSSEKLIAIKKGGEYLYPAFQFNDSGKLNGLDEILEKLKGLGTVTKCSFLTMKIDFNDMCISPIDILKLGLDGDYLSYILREASLYGLHTAR